MAITNRSAAGLALAIAIAASGGAASASILADSVGDYALGTNQGFNSWFYGYYDGDSADPYSTGDFEEMVLDSGVYWADPGRVWTGGTGSWLHPNAINAGRDDDIHHAVRRWLSYYEGQAVLSGTIAHDYDTAQGDGATAKIIVDGVVVYTADLAAGDAIGFQYEVFVDLSIDSKVDFIVTAGANDSSTFDTGNYSSRITAVPTPGALSFLGLAGLAVARRRR